MDFSLENRHRCIQALALQCSLYTPPDPTHLPWLVMIREGLRRFTAEKELFSFYPRVDHLLLQGLVVLCIHLKLANQVHPTTVMEESSCKLV